MPPPRLSNTQLANATPKAMVRPLAASNAAPQPEEAVAPKQFTSQGKEKPQKIKVPVKNKSSVKILTKKRERRELFQKG